MYPECADGEGMGSGPQRVATWRGWMDRGSGASRPVTSARLSSTARPKNRLFPKTRSWFALDAPLELLSPLSVLRVLFAVATVAWPLIGLTRRGVPIDRCGGDHRRHRHHRGALGGAPVGQGGGLPGEPAVGRLVDGGGRACWCGPVTAPGRAWPSPSSSCPSSCSWPCSSATARSWWTWRAPPPSSGRPSSPSEGVAQAVLVSLFGMVALATAPGHRAGAGPVGPSSRHGGPRHRAAQRVRPGPVAGLPGTHQLRGRRPWPSRASATPARPSATRWAPSFCAGRSRISVRCSLPRR